ncbi:MAG: hypothetical protein AAGC57_06435 [Pseudomonadota bacterium]
MPILLPAERFCRDGKMLWWQSADAAHCLPLANGSGVADPLRGMDLRGAAGLWSGDRLAVLAAQTEDWGRVGFDA